MLEKIVGIRQRDSAKSIIKETVDSIPDLNIPKKDKKVLVEGVAQVWDFFEQHNSSFLSEKLYELFGKFEDPLADKTLALEEFQDAIRSS